MIPLVEIGYDFTSTIADVQRNHWSITLPRNLHGISLHGLLIHYGTSTVPSRTPHGTCMHLGPITVLSLNRASIRDSPRCHGNIIYIHGLINETSPNGYHRSMMNPSRYLNSTISPSRDLGGTMVSMVPSQGLLPYLGSITHRTSTVPYIVPSWSRQYHTTSTRPQLLSVIHNGPIFKSWNRRGSSCRVFGGECSTCRLKCVHRIFWPLKSTGSFIREIDLR